MDEEKLNNDLKNRIREVFDNYEDTGADDGWLLLREKFPVQEKDRGLGWLWYAAAAMVLLCSAIWLIPKANKTTPTIVRVPQQQTHQPKNLTRLPAGTALTVSSNKQQTANVIIKPATKPVITSPYTTVNTPTGFTTLNKSDSGPLNPVVKQGHAVVTPATDSATTLATNNIPNKLPANTGGRAIHSPQAQTTLPPVAEHQKDIYDLLAENSNNEHKKTKGTSNKPIISIYAATYFNYARGSDSRVNLGAGFTSDFHITNKLKLSTGLAIAQNTLNYSNGAEPDAQRHEAGFANLAASVAKASGAPITGNGSAQSLAVFANNLGGTKNYNASLVGLDIPVNLKFEFNPQKSDTYVSAGVSSGTFINETYRSVYSYSQVSRESATHNSFSSFDIAKTLNFSFGVGYPLGKNNRLIVEPFFKYPLDGLGEQQLRFGAGGVNLKLNFRSLKKKSSSNIE